MISPRTKRFASLMIVPVAIVLLAAFFGMFLPIAVYEIFRNDSFELHNVVWEGHATFIQWNTRVGLLHSLVCSSGQCLS
jgi:hypothetical protein